MTPLNEVKATCCEKCFVGLFNEWEECADTSCKCHTEKAVRAIPEWELLNSQLADLGVASKPSEIFPAHQAILETINRLLTTREAETIKRCKKALKSSQENCMCYEKNILQLDRLTTNPKENI